MLKKLLISCILCVVMIISYMSMCYAIPVEVTKENLNEAFQKVASEYNESNLSFIVSDNEITVTEDGETYTLSYDLSNKPTFLFEIPIEKGMSYDDFKKQTDNLKLPMFGYIAVANIQGVEIKDALLYFIFSYLGTEGSFSFDSSNSYMIIDDTNIEDGITIETTNPNAIYASQFGERVMEYVNAVYPETQTRLDSEEINSYVMTFEKKDVTETSCKLVATLKVNTDADFSELNGFMDKIENDSTNNEKIEDESNNISNLEKLPNTGNENNLLVALYTLVGVCILGVIFLLHNLNKRR